MGIIRQGILGGFSGKVANVVGSSWKGIAVMKSLPLSVANPRTTAQTAQRTKFTNTVAFAVMILSSYIKPFWDRFAQQQSGFNAFISANVDLFVDEVPEPLADLVLSRGKIEKVDPTNVTRIGAGTPFVVEFSSTLPGSFASTEDEVACLIFNETKGEYIANGINGGVTRSTESIPAGVNATWDDTDTLHVYLVFRRPDGTVVSNTGYWTGSVT